jgi:hypothetical protein
MNVEEQIALLNGGKPLEAFDQFFATDGVMYANGEVFARGAVAGRKKQEPYIASAEEIVGNIVDLVVSEGKGVCAFRNRTFFTTTDGEKHQIDGVCWQRWLDGKIVEERYFDGDEMRRMLHAGILTSPEDFT